MRTLGAWAVARPCLPCRCQGRCRARRSSSGRPMTPATPSLGRLAASPSCARASGRTATAQQKPWGSCVFVPWMGIADLALANLGCAQRSADVELRPFILHGLGRGCMLKHFQDFWLNRFGGSRRTTRTGSPGHSPTRSPVSCTTWPSMPVTSWSSAGSSWHF